MESETMKTLMEEFKEKNVQMLERIVQQHVTEKDAKSAEMNQTFAELIKENEAKGKEIEELKQTLTDVQKSLSNSVDINSHLNGLHKTENAKLRHEICKNETTISDLKEDVENAKEENEALQTEIFQFKNSNIENQKVIDQQAKRILKIEAKIKGNPSETISLMNRHEKIVMEKENKNTELQQEIEICKKALQKKEKIIYDRDIIIEKEKIEKAKIQDAHHEEKNQLLKEIAFLKTKVMW